MDEIVLPDGRAAWRAEGTPYRGVLYAGLMIDRRTGPQLLEYNCRFGDPECQVAAAAPDDRSGQLLLGGADGALRPHATCAGDPDAL